MLNASGTLSVEPHKGRIVLNVSEDFVRLYYWFISREYWIKFQTPLHGAHITIFSQKHHARVNWRKALAHHGKQVEFEYDPCIVEGGFTKGFIMYYIRIFSSELDEIKDRLKIEDGKNFRGLHVTIGNGKNNNIHPDWPKMIEIR